MTPKFVSVFLCSFIFGAIVGSLYALPSGLLWESALLSSAVASMALMFSREWGFSSICLILGIVFGIWYVGTSFGVNEYQDLIGKNIDVEGVIAADPVSGSNPGSQKLVLLPDGFHQYVNTSLYKGIPGAKQGDRVWIRGQVQMPENFNDFDYVGYLQRWQIYAELKKPHVIVLHRISNSWRTPLRFIHDYIVKRTQVFQPEEGSLILGILIGERTSIPDEVVQAFKTTGLTHIVAVSGFNMTIIATACGALVWYIGRRATNLLTLAVVFAFVVITGATASVVRAAIMAVLMVVGQLLGRQYLSLYALLIVCAIMILQNPRIVVWDIGFQLSVAATFGVLIAFKIKRPEATEPSLSTKQNSFTAPIKNFLSETLRPTLGAIAITAPIIAYHFQTFSLIAPLANLIVLPSVTWIMLLGALVLIPYIGNAFVYPTQLLTHLALTATEKLSHVPYASIQLHLPLWVDGIYYLLAFGYIIAKSG